MTIEIPDELIGSLNKGRLVLFVGHDLDISESGLPSMASLASELAQKTKAWQDCPICRDAGKCMRPGECILPFRRIATIYEQENGINDLVRFLQDRLTEGIPVTPILQAITRLPIKTVVTTAYDERLERAYEAASIPYQKTAADSQVVADESKQVQILHLYGVLSQPESLVLTEADHAALSINKPLIAIMLQSYLVTRACLVVAIDFNDPYLQTLYSRTVKELGDLRRWPYVLESHPGRLSVKAHYLTATPSKLLLKLKSKLDYRPAALPPPPKPRAPYKFLDYFEAEDRAIFIGRDAEITELTSRVMSHRMTVLYAYSGMGKTSLLQAGVIPQLRFEGFRVESIRLGTDLLADLQAVMQRMATSSGSGAISVDSPASSSTGQVLIVDQAEELFTIHTLDERAEYVKALLACLDEEQHNLRVLLSLRIEYLGQLEDLFSGQERSDVLSNRFRLGALGPEQTRQAIIKPAALFQIKYEEALTDALLAYLETASFDPAQLQILCYQLHKDLESLDKADSEVVTLERYKELGEAEGILADLMEDILAQLGDQEAQERAKVILKNMVTIERTKDALKSEEIARRVAYASLSETQVRETLKLLQSQRVVRRLEDGRYELAHDVLVSKIWTWMDEADLARLNAAQTLKQAMSHYFQYHHLMSADKQIAVEQAAGAMVLRTDELAILLMSAIATNDRERAQIWVRRIDADKSTAVLAILEDAQQSEVRDRALRAELLIRDDLPPLLIRAFRDRFNLPEMQDLCFRLDVDFDQLGAETKTGKSRELVKIFIDKGRFDVLAATVRFERPDIRELARFEIAPPPRSDASNLFDSLVAEFDLEQLDNMCQYLELKRGDLLLRGGKTDYVRRLITVMRRLGKLDHLRLAIVRFRPDLMDVTAELERALVARFDIEQMRTLCFDLDVDYDYLDASEKRRMAIELVHLLSRHDRTSDLIDAIVFPDRVGKDRYEVVLRRRLAEKMDRDSLYTLCFDLNVKWDDLSGNSLDAKSRELILHMRRRERLGELVFWTMHNYPQVLSEEEVWDKMRIVFGQSGETQALLRRMFGESLAEVTPSRDVDLQILIENQSPRVALRLILGQLFEYDEFMILCWDLGVDLEDLGGEVLADKMRELIVHLEGQNRMQDLASYIMQVRPHVAHLIAGLNLNETN